MPQNKLASVPFNTVSTGGTKTGSHNDTDTDTKATDYSTKYVSAMYFGQNLDKPTAEYKGETQPLMSEPSYKISSENYKVYKHELPTVDDLTGAETTRTAYSNWNNPDTFRSIDDMITVKADASDYQKGTDGKLVDVNNSEEVFNEPLAKLFDIVLNGGRSIMSVIPDYESAYS